jgi:fused signal recognition particle receptor
VARAQKSDSPLDRLYQLPLSEFVSARNALAKESGADAAEIRSLQKPSVPAWAVNQLYWQRRDVYDDLIARAQDLRATHDATLGGKRADLRGASRAHEDAVEAALKATLSLLAGDGQPATEATRQAVATTLRGLPADEAPGRLTRQLQPRGFEMLAGALPGGTVRPAPPVKIADRAPAAGPGKTTAAAGTQDRERQAAAREALTIATRDARLSEQAARREEFESARAAREAEKAQQRVEIARETLREAQAALDTATREAEAAEEARIAAQARSERAAKDVKESREREKKARAAAEKA